MVPAGQGAGRPRAGREQRSAEERAGTEGGRGLHCSAVRVCVSVGVWV